jgi:glycosyltransferase involved in cell wall biosynthesis
VKVAFDSRPTRDTRGVGRYARCLLQALREGGRGELVETHDPKRCDVFHSPWLDGALLRSPVPMVVTLHDMSPLKRRGEFLRSGLRFKLRYLAVQRAMRVIVPTQAVAREAVDALELPAERVVVIGEAVAPALHPRPEAEVEAVRLRFKLPERYLLWVGGLQIPDPRKRVAALARAPRNLPLVLVGAVGPWARELPDVTLTGVVDDDELAAIYTGAHALIFPSDDEGFGLPPVEALACGTPVAASDLPALREVLGGRAALRPVDDLDGLIAAAETAERPAPPPPAWTWEDAAEATWNVYADALDEVGAAPGRMTTSRLSPAPQRSRVSSMSVTGPSFTSSTAIVAPNTPRRAPSRSQTRS